MSKPRSPEPTSGQPISMGRSGVLSALDNPIVSFMEGDGSGRDIWKASKRITDAAATYDFHRSMEGATMVRCSEFATEVIKHMED